MSIDVTATTGTRTIDEDARTWAEAWQSSWDAQQTGFLFDREQRFAALLDLVEVTAGPAPTVVDLACGTASITRRLLARLPGARAVSVDVDPVLLAIARGSLGGDERVRIVRADLRDPAWVDRLDGVEADAVVTPPPCTGCPRTTWGGSTATCTVWCGPAASSPTPTPCRPTTCRASAAP
jgi:SAM-dependent methyltransferase